MQTQTSNLPQTIQSWWSDQHRHLGNYDDFSALFRGYSFTPSGQGCGWQNGRTRDELVRELAGQIKASDVDVAKSLETPEGRFATTVVAALLPPPYGDEFTFLVDIVDAAGTRSVKTRFWSLVGALVIGSLLVLGISRAGPVTL
jgi:hypothetical protein